MAGGGDVPAGDPRRCCRCGCAGVLHVYERAERGHDELVVGHDIPGGLAVTVAVAVGNSSTNVEYAATVQSAVAGTWHCTVTVPDLATFFVQVKVTDSQTNSYIYANKVFSAETSLF